MNILIYIINPNTFDRIIFHSINQLKILIVYFVSSYRHDLHYFTAIQMFKEKPIFGHGLKSFRYKCMTLLIRLKKILKDKSIYAPVNGLVAINQVSGEIFIVTKENRVFNVANFTKNISEKRLTNFQEVNKGDYLGSYYEFINGY